MTSENSKPSPGLDLVKKDSSTYDELPYERVVLPSRGKLYSIEHPLYKQEYVEFKAMTATEENILATPALLKAGTAINVLIKSCLVDKQIDPLSLLCGDRSALLMAIRISGFGTEYRVNTACPICSFQFPYTFDLSRVEIKELEEEPIEHGQNLFSMTLPKTKATVKYSLPVDGDDLDIAKIQEARKKMIKSSDAPSTIVTDRLKLAIKEVNGKTDGAYISKFVEKMPALDSRKLRQHINKIAPNILLKEKVSCTNCGVESEHGFQMGTEFFWPELGD